MRIAQAQRDANDRFHAIIWPHAETLLRTARFLVKDRAEADDIAQETLIKAFGALDRFQDGTDVRAWLFTILRHTRIDHIRASKTEHANVSLDQVAGTLEEPASEPIGAVCMDQPNADQLLDSFSDRQVIQALQRLPEEICFTLLLVDVQGLGHEDAAKILEVPVGTVKSRAFRGRQMLREGLLPVARDLRYVD